MMRNRWRVTDNLIYEFRCILEKFAKLKDDLTCGAKKRNTSGWTEVLSDKCTDQHQSRLAFNSLLSRANGCF